MTEPTRTKTDAEIGRLVQKAAALGPYPEYLNQTAEQFARWADAELARRAAISSAADAVTDGAADANPVLPTTPNTDAAVVPGTDGTHGPTHRRGRLRAPDLHLDDLVLDPAVSQAAFDAAWELRTRWYRGERVTAAECAGQRATPPVPVLHALAEAEWHARSETGKAPPPFVEVLRSVLPERAERAARLREVGPQRDTVARAYPYLSDQPHGPTPGYLGRLGRYRVIRELGRGATSVVFEVEKNTLPAPTKRALKVLALEGAPEEQARVRTQFVREAEAACHLDHRNIVRVHDAAEESGGAWIEMDRVYGPRLRDLADHHCGPVPLDLALDLVRQVALGLAAAHASSPPVVHRDLKPVHVLLERATADAAHPHGWRARVCDFGLARAVHDPSDTRSGVAVGTLAYLSPEQLNGSSSIGSKADLFALGVVAYELLTGTHPYWHSEDDTSPAVVRRILSAAAPPPRELNPAIPESVAEFVLRMLRPNPEHRPSAADVAVKLSGFRRTTEPATERPATSRELTRPSAPINTSAGDPTAFAVLVQKHSFFLRAVLSARRWPSSLVDDAVQEAFLAYWLRAADLRWESDDEIRDWLRKVATRWLINQQQKPARDTISVDDLTTDRPDHHDTPAQVAELEDESRRVWNLLQTLPAHELEVIALRFFQGLKISEIASLHRIPEVDVRSRLDRALSHLRAASEESESAHGEGARREE